MFQVRSRARWLVAVALLSVVVAQAAPAAPQRSGNRVRTVNLRYEGSVLPYVGGPLPLMCEGCVDIASRPGERYATVEIIDDRSPVGHLDLVWDSRGDDDPGYFTVCGGTTEPQPIPANATLTIYPWAIPGESCPDGFSTSGNVKITFSRKP